ncbi:universal stress protein [Streptomyces coeruleorubidus]|uniref:universal stress protein n=1 Tax=Streptomyces coeruleorubidus TaxID=116188 RepID=UPI00237F6170|nr:universal stress protein [Streptomyces coeruleorubidus]WDV49735.1 universal stress protein [Streptomyces coeruleorubidus]
MKVSHGRHGTVLVGIDDTPHTWLAADWAATEARLRGAALRVLHAVGPGTEEDEETGRRLREAAAGLLEHARARTTTSHPGLRVDTVLARDHPAEALLDASQDTDLVVVGTRGRGGFTGPLLGSVSLKVAAHADRPVAVVRGHTERAASGGIVVGCATNATSPPYGSPSPRRTCAGFPPGSCNAWTPLAAVGVVVPQVSQVDQEQRLHARLLNQAARPVAEFPQVHTDIELVLGSPSAALVAASERAGLWCCRAMCPAAGSGCGWGRWCTPSCTMRAAVALVPIG